MTPHTQNRDILSYLQAGGSLTGLDALRLFGTMKLASRVSELRDEGYDIKDEWVYNEQTKKHYKKYWIQVKTEINGQYAWV